MDRTADLIAGKMAAPIEQRGSGDAYSWTGGWDDDRTGGGIDSGKIDNSDSNKGVKTDIVKNCGIDS